MLCFRFFVVIHNMYHLIDVRCIIFPATIFFMLPEKLNFVFVRYSIPLNDVMPSLSVLGVLISCKGYGWFIYLKII